MKVGELITKLSQYNREREVEFHYHEWLWNEDNGDEEECRIEERVTQVYLNDDRDIVVIQ